jgi:hypothetical protein
MPSPHPIGFTSSIAAPMTKAATITTTASTSPQQSSQEPQQTKELVKKGAAPINEKDLLAPYQDEEGKDDYSKLPEGTLWWRWLLSLLLSFYYLKSFS